LNKSDLSDAGGWDVLVDIGFKVLVLLLPALAGVGLGLEAGFDVLVDCWLDILANSKY
jgi:hypothetical protein